MHKLFTATCIMAILLLSGIVFQLHSQQESFELNLVNDEAKIDGVILITKGLLKDVDTNKDNIKKNTDDINKLKKPTGSAE